MPGQNWFVYINGETFGPLTTEVVVLLLKQGRVQFSDFIWGGSQTKWARILEIKDFEVLLPEYPKTPIPPRSDVPAMPAESLDRDAQLSSQRKVHLRRFPRVSINAKFVTQDYGSFDVQNISEGGLYVKSSTVLLPVGTKVSFRLEAPIFPEPLEMGAVVVRLGSANDPSGFGVEFTRMTTDQKRIIREYVQAKA